MDLLFEARTHHREIALGAANRKTGSRVGGRPPEPCASALPRCPLCEGPLQYVLTIAADLLGPQLGAGNALSLLICREYLCSAKSHRLIEPSSMLLVLHEDAPPAAGAGELDSECEPHQLTLGAEEIPDPIVDDDWVSTDASKVGGRPGYIQSWGPEEAADGGDFLLQWSENTLAGVDFETGTSPFDFGVVYVFRKSPGRFWAFWQS